MACAADVLWTHIQAARHLYPPSYFVRPSLDLFRTTFAGLFPDALLLLALVVFWIAWFGTRDMVISLPPMQSSERVGWFFLLIPLAGYLLAQIPHVYYLRYLICTLPGVAVAFSCWSWRHFHDGARRVTVGVLLILTTWGLVRQVTATRDPNRFYYSPVRQILSMENPLRNDGKRFFVFSNEARFVEAWHHSKHPEEYVLLVSCPSCVNSQFIMLARYYPMQLWTLDDLRKHSRETAFFPHLPSDLDTLKQAGFQIETPAPKSLQVVYLK